MGSKHTTTNTTKATLILASVVAFLFTILFLSGLFKTPTSETKWDEVTYTDPNGDIQLRPSYQNELDRKTLEYGEVEQHALKAISSGDYLCYSCADSTYFLKADEVWKYGITRKGESKRYTASFLRDNNLYYEVQFRGNLYECAIEEQVKLRQYPILKENLARKRENRLVKPPGNKVLN